MARLSVCFVENPFSALTRRTEKVFLVRRGSVQAVLVWLAAAPALWQLGPPTCFAQAEPRDETARVALIDRLIGELSNNSHEIRTNATAQLINMGPKAVEALKQAAHDDDLEMALRARSLLAVFGELLFSGVSIELEASSRTVAWAEPITLVVRMYNPTPYVAHLPIERLGGGSDTAAPHVRQVTGLLDVADYLRVIGPGGELVTLHLDDITEDEQVLAAVNARVEAPPTSNLAPGATVHYRVEAFNRGWARYRFLRRGVYTVQLVYQPVWNDEKLIRVRVGRVTSNVLSITIDEPAPACVRDARQPARVRLERSGRQWVASLQNLTDVAVWVNMNLASDQGPPAARLRWFVSRGARREEITPAVPNSDSALAFSRDLLTKLPPGASVELGRTPVSSLTASSVCTPAGGGDGCTIHAVYSNITGIVWQRAQASGLLGNSKAPKALREPLPRRMLVTTLSSAHVSFQAEED